MKEYSKDEVKHFRHDIIYNGLCINWCKDKLSKLNHSNYLFQSSFDVDHKVYYTYNNRKYEMKN